jgi:hypothetical protein
MNKYMGPIFSLVMCLGMAALSVYFLVDKLPPLAPIATGGIAVICGVMVVSDWKTVWGPLLTGKSSS